MIDAPNPVVVPATQQETFDKWEITEFSISGNQLVAILMPGRVSNGVDIMGPTTQSKLIIISDVKTVAAGNPTIAGLISDINSAIATYAIANGVI